MLNLVANWYVQSHWSEKIQKNKGVRYYLLDGVGDGLRRTGRHDQSLGRVRSGNYGSRLGLLLLGHFLDVATVGLVVGLEAHALATAQCQPAKRRAQYIVAVAGVVAGAKGQAGHAILTTHFPHALIKFPVPLT